MSYEADARQELINRLRNVYSSQAHAYSGAALSEEDMAELMGYRESMQNLRKPLTKSGRTSLSKANCPKGTRRVCTEAACVDKNLFPQYRIMQLRERALIKKSRSRAAKAGGGSKWVAHVKAYMEKERKAGRPIKYAQALRDAKSSYGDKEGRGDKSGRKKRVPKPRTKKAAKAVDKVEVAAAAAVDAGASPAQVVAAAAEGTDTRLTYGQFAKTGKLKGLGSGKGVRRKRYDEYLATGKGYDDNDYYGSGRSGGVMMDSMYGDGYGGVLMDVYDNY